MMICFWIYYVEIFSVYNFMDFPGPESALNMNRVGLLQVE